MKAVLQLPKLVYIFCLTAVAPSQWRKICLSSNGSCIAIVVFFCNANQDRCNLYLYLRSLARYHKTQINTVVFGQAHAITCLFHSMHNSTSILTQLLKILYIIVHSFNLERQKKLSSSRAAGYLGVIQADTLKKKKRIVSYEFRRMGCAKRHLSTALRWPPRGPLWRRRPLRR